MTTSENPWRFIALLPAGGWRIAWIGDDGQVLRSEPLVGWGMDGGGNIYPLHATADGEVWPASEDDPPHRIYHPDTEVGAA